MGEATATALHTVVAAGRERNLGLDPGPFSIWCSTVSLQTPFRMSLVQRVYLFSSALLSTTFPRSPRRAAHLPMRGRGYPPSRP